MDIDKCIEKVKECTYLSQRQLRELCTRLKDILLLESNVLDVTSPVSLCGDIHGQFFDLLQLFEVGGQPPQAQYVFMGDYVDRGYNSVETIQLLFLLKLKFPKRITLLRGNHQTSQTTKIYGFYDEMFRKYGNAKPWKYSVEVFDFLPLAALVDRKILCIHGGLSPGIKIIDQIRCINRKQEIPHQGPFTDLMWSDPQEIENWTVSTRGAGWFFGHKPVRDFSYLNGLQLIARAHQLVQQGYQFWFKQNRLVTIWSAPNYCYKCNNVGAILKLKEHQKQFIIFDTVPQSVSSTNYTNVLPYFL